MAEIDLADPVQRDAAFESAGKEMVSSINAMLEAARSGGGVDVLSGSMFTALLHTMQVVLVLAADRKARMDEAR